MSNKHQELASQEANGFCKELASPKQTALGKDISNPLIVDSLLKTIWLSMYHVIAMKHWLFQSKRLLKESIQIESHKSSIEHPIVNEFIIINIPEEDVEPEPNLPLQEIIILDPDDQPMWESAKTVALTPNSAIIQLDVDDNFVINSTHLNMIRGNKFDGYLRVDPHDHIREFLAICNMFRYGKTQSEAVLVR
ncbi:hypothetical protein Tco_1225518 [Tanacetum coccineum]